jgi:hypothetical protein
MVTKNAANLLGLVAVINNLLPAILPPASGAPTTLASE